MARNVSRQADALATARERRRKLDRERDEKDERIEAATAAVLVALVDHADVARKLEQATADVGKVLKVLLGRVSQSARGSAGLLVYVADVGAFGCAVGSDRAVDAVV